MKKLLFFIWATGLLFILPTTSMAFTIGNAHQSGVGYFDKMEIFAIPGYASFDSGFISQEANWTANLVNPGYSVMTGPSDNDVYFTIEFEDPQQSWGVYFITWSGNAKVEIGQWVDLAWTDLGTTG